MTRPQNAYALGLVAVVALTGACTGRDTNGESSSSGANASSGGTSSGASNAGSSSGGSTSGSGGNSSSSSSSSTGSTGGGGGYFPAGAWMNQDISQAPLDADSGAITQWLEDAGGWGLGRMQIDFSIEVLEATAATPRQTFEPTGDFYSPDCDRARMPVPVGGALEGEDGYACTQDGDCHLIAVDRAANQLFEMWRANITGGTFNGGCLAVWDLARVYPADGRGEQCTSADAAGFPIAPLLFSADEVAAGQINHAIRFILPNARMRRAVYARPGTHAGGPSATGMAPVYGSRWRLKQGFDMSRLPNEAARVVARAMQRYGMALADGGNVALTAQSDRFTTAKWAAVGLEARDLQAIQPNDFEVIDTGPPITLTYDCMRTPLAEF